jgi:hypothetical protein
MYTHSTKVKRNDGTVHCGPPEILLHIQEVLNAMLNPKPDILTGFSLFASVPPWDGVLKRVMIMTHQLGDTEG